VADRTPFFAASRPSVYERNGQTQPLYYDRVAEDGAPYRGPRQTWSEEQYERRTHRVKEFNCRWFNLCDPEDLRLYRHVMEHVVNKWYTRRLEHRMEPEFSDGPTRPPTTQWVYLEWTEHYVEGKPVPEPIEDLGLPSARPLF
jgi:hypothetical protein